MRKILGFFIGAICFVSGALGADLATDTSDPLFLQKRSQMLSKTSLMYFDNGLRLRQEFSYGLMDRLAVGGHVHYQQDFDGDQDGFSSIDLGGVYRMGIAAEDSRRIIYDMLFGLKFGGNRHVRTPDFADSSYYVGLRLGRQYDGLTLAGTIKSSWIFDDKRGLAFIDFIPEAYFRVTDVWRVGGVIDLRKATNPDYDEESVGIKIVRQYGRTQYTGTFEYAIEADAISGGLHVNILF